RLWDAATGRALRTLAVPAKDGAPDRTLLTALEFAPDGRKLLTVRTLSPVTPLPGGPGGRAAEEPRSPLCVWGTATGAVVRRWQAPPGVLGAAFTPDGQGVVTAAADGVTLWEAATGRQRFRAAGAEAVRCAPDGRVLAAADGPTIRLLDLRTGKE